MLLSHNVIINLFNLRPWSQNPQIQLLWIDEKETERPPSDFDKSLSLLDLGRCIRQIQLGPCAGGRWQLGDSSH